MPLVGRWLVRAPRSPEVLVVGDEVALLRHAHLDQVFDDTPRRLVSEELVDLAREVS